MSRALLFVRGFRRGFGEFGLFVADAVNLALLLVAYVIGVGSAALAARLFGKRFLDLEKSQQKSYWTQKKIGKRDLDDYYRQY